MQPLAVSPIATSPVALLPASPEFAAAGPAAVFLALLADPVAPVAAAPPGPKGKPGDKDLAGLATGDKAEDAAAVGLAIAVPVLPLSDASFALAKADSAAIETDFSLPSPRAAAPSDPDAALPAGPVSSATPPLPGRSEGSRAFLVPSSAPGAGPEDKAPVPVPAAVPAAGPFAATASPPGDPLPPLSSEPPSVSPRATGVEWRVRSTAGAEPLASAAPGPATPPSPAPVSGAPALPGASPLPASPPLSPAAADQADAPQPARACSPVPAGKVVSDGLLAPPSPEEHLAEAAPDRPAAKPGPDGLRPAISAVAETVLPQPAPVQDRARPQGPGAEMPRAARPDPPRPDVQKPVPRAGAGVPAGPVAADPGPGLSLPAPAPVADPGPPSAPLPSSALPLHPAVSAPPHDPRAAPPPPQAAPVLAQLVQAAGTARPGLTELRLSPEELGAVRIDLRTEGDQAILTLSAERPDTLDLMRRHADRLASDLRAAGFQQLDLSFGRWAGQGQPQGGQPGWSQTPTPPADPSPPPRAPDAVPAPPRPRSAGENSLYLRI